MTAQRRTESMQDVPISIAALTGETLGQLNVTNFTDYAKFLPNVTTTSVMPGLGQIYIRGLATTESGAQSSGPNGQFPNVAVYLDEQSVQLPGRNLDIYAADLERIEVLKGPQGTLFGAGAQAGVIRYITNKPKTDRTEAAVTASYGWTATGDPSSAVEGVLNLPLIEGKFAVRGVVYNEVRGGYVDNVSSTFTRRGTDQFIVNYFGGVVPPGSPVISNDALTEQNFNSVSYKGLRVSALYQVNDDWDILLTQSNQAMRADGVFLQMPLGAEDQPLPELSVTTFNDNFNKDEFSNTALTINGRIGALKAIYTGGYLKRDVDQLADYTTYSRGAYAGYYQCILPGSPFVDYEAQDPSNPGTCKSPSATFRVTTENVHQSHELRLNSPDDKRLRVTGGLFWEDFEIGSGTDWMYKAPDAGFSPIVPPTGSTAINPNVRNSSTAFINDITRGYKQKAAFASLDYDLLPDKLTLSLGTRYFEMDTYEVGSRVGSYGCRVGGIYSNGFTNTEECRDGYSASNLDTIELWQQLVNFGVPPGTPNNELFPAYVDSATGLQKTYDGFRSRVNLTWKINEDAMTYATWSEGFRPGGFNRGTGFVGFNSPLLGSGWFPPVGFSSDTLINREIGWKTLWLDSRLQFNGAVYDLLWKDTQVSLFAPGITGNLLFTANGPDYRVRGIEFDTVARVTPALTLALAASFNDSALLNEVNFVDGNGQPIDWSSLEDYNGNPLSNPFGTKGTNLARAPTTQASIRARYDFQFGEYAAFWQLAGSYRSSQWTTTDRLGRNQDGSLSAVLDKGYAEFDGSLGVSRDAWRLELYCSNIADRRSVDYTAADGQVVTRPRTISLRFGYHYGGQ